MKRLGAVAIVVVFVAALYVLRAELAHVHVHEVLAAFRGIPTGALLVALGFTVCSYLVLTGYDVLAVPGVPPDVLLASVLAYRVLYYLLPLTLAAALLAAHELGSQRDRLARLVERTGAEVGTHVGVHAQPHHRERHQLSPGLRPPPGRQPSAARSSG